MFKIKNNGILRACLVDFSYREGIDFTDIHSPVMHEVALCIMIMMKIVLKWSIIKIDVEKEFLDSILEEIIHIDLPRCLEYVKMWMQGM